MYIYWIFLTAKERNIYDREIITSIKIKPQGNGGFILMLVMISLSYIFLSFAVKKIQ